MVKAIQFLRIIDCSPWLFSSIWQYLPPPSSTQKWGIYYATPKKFDMSDTRVKDPGKCTMKRRTVVQDIESVSIVGKIATLWARSGAHSFLPTILYLKLLCCPSQFEVINLRLIQRGDIQTIINVWVWSVNKSIKSWHEVGCAISEVIVTRRQDRE